MTWFFDEDIVRKVFVEDGHFVEKATCIGCVSCCCILESEKDDDEEVGGIRGWDRAQGVKSPRSPAESKFNVCNNMMMLIFWAFEYFSISFYATMQHIWWYLRSPLSCYEKYSVFCKKKSKRHHICLFLQIQWLPTPLCSAIIYLHIFFSPLLLLIRSKIWIEHFGFVHHYDQLTITQ